MDKHTSSTLIKWKIVAIILLIAIVLQLVPAKFADYVWLRVRAAEDGTNNSDGPAGDASSTLFEGIQDISDGIVENNKVLSVYGELTDIRTRNSKTYRLSDGTFYSTIFNYPIHKEQNGRWTDVNNTLIVDEENGRINNLNGTFNVSFPQSWQSGEDRIENNNISVSGDRGYISYTLDIFGRSFESVAAITDHSRVYDNSDDSELDKLKILPNLESSLKYNCVSQGVSLEYIVTPSGLKENVILEAPLTETEIEEGLEYYFDAGDLEAELVENRIIFKDETGTPIYIFSAPLMFDSLGNKSGGLILSFYMDKSLPHGRYIIKLSADIEWLLSKERVYPVTIDPSIITEGYTVIDSVATVDSNGDVFQGFAFVGNSSRSFIKLSWPELPTYAVLVDADFSVYYDAPYYSGHVVGQAIEENWTLSSLSTSLPDLSTYPFQAFDYVFNGQTPLSLNVTAEAKKYYRYGQNYGIMLKCDNLAYQITLFSSVNTDITVLSVRFSNHQGLEDQWNTHTASVSSLSGSIYVKDATGDFVYIHEDFTTPGDILPLSVSHVFNITEGNNNCEYGYGFRLNLMRTLEYNSDLNAYIYTDEDGTKHYFLNSGTNTYYLEEDPSIKVKLDSGSLYIVWPDSSRMKFDISYNDINYISEFEDYRGFTQTFEYVTVSNKKLMTKATDGAGNYLQFLYSSGYLTSINVNSSTSKQLSFQYDSGKLCRITYPDSTYTQFYSTSRTVNGTSYYYPKRIVDPSGVMMRVAVSSGTLRVSRVYKKAAGSGDSTVVDAEYASFEYSSDYTKVRYGYGSSNTKTETVYFDYYGRAASVIDDLGNMVVLDYDEDNNVFNNILRTHSALIPGHNYVKDPSFETSGASGWSSFGTLCSFSTYIGSRFSGLLFGEKSISVVSYQSSGYAGCAKNISLPAGTYTASVYCDVSSGSGSGGAVVAFVYNDSGNVQHIEKSVPETGNSRIQVTFTVPSGATSQKLLLGTYSYTGTVYFDAVQVEEGARATHFNAVDDGGAQYAVGDNWSTGVSRTYDSERDGYVLRITADPDNPVIGYQQVKAVKGDTTKQYMRLSGWAKLPNHYEDSFASLEIKFYNSSGNIISGKTKIFHFDTNLNSWQYISNSFSVNFAFSYVSVSINYDYGIGYAYFDDISLTAENAFEDFEIDTEFGYNQFGWLIEEIGSDRAVTNHWYYENLSSPFFGRKYEDEITDIDGNVTDSQYSYNPTVTDLSTILTVYTPADSSLDTITTLTEYKYGNSSAYYGHPTSVITKVQEGNNELKLTECRSISYDTDNMLPLSETDIIGNTKVYSYSSFGELLSITENGVATTYTYDSMGRVTGTSSKARVGTTNNATVNVSFAYNSGRLSTINRTNSFYGFTFDSLGRPLSVTVNRTSGGNTYTTTIAGYAYSTINGQVSILAYGNNQYKNFSYNTSGQVTAVYYSDTTGTDYTTTYSDSGDTVSRYNLQDNLTKNYSYDWDGRLVHTYFSNGRSIKYTYLDKNGESSVLFHGLASLPDIFTYKTYSDERYTQTTISGNVSAYSYRFADEYGRLSSTSVGNTNYMLNSTYSYLTAGTYFDSGNYLFEKLSGRVGTVNYLKETVSSGSTSAITGLPTLTYTYDAKGNIETISENSVQKVKYYYDAQDQLIREDNKLLNSGSGYTIEYRYNADGNMTAKLLYNYTTGSTFPSEYSNSIASVFMGYSASNGWRDQMTSYNGNAVTFDGAGNVLSYNNGTSMTLSWAQGNRLASVTRGSTQSTFIYDESGYRTKKTVGSTVYTYTWDGSRLVSQDTGTAGSEIVFLYDDSGSLFGFRKGTTVYYYAKNLQGDVIAILDSNMNVVAKYVYDSWGKLLSVTGLEANTIGAENPIRYRGYYYDSESGLYYLKSRYYDPEINRFVSSDAFTSTGQKIVGYNMYVYCNNNPIVYIDSDGYFSWRGFLYGLGLFALGVVAVVAAPAALAVGAVAVAITGAIISSAAATDSTIVLDFTGSYMGERKGHSLVIDFDNDHTKIEVYAHYGSGTSDSPGFIFSCGVVNNYTGRGSYGGEFIEYGGAVNNIGVSHSFDPAQNGTSATCFTFSSGAGLLSAGISSDYYIPLLYWEVGG